MKRSAGKQKTLITLLPFVPLSCEHLFRWVLFYLVAVNERFFLFSCSVDFIFGLNKTKWEVHFLFAVFSKFILKSSALIANGEQQNNFKYAQCAQVVSNDWIQQQMLNFCCLPQTWFLAFIFSVCKPQIVSAARKPAD